jgi:hypothetical protein
VARRSVGEQVSRVLPELYALTSVEQFPARALSLVRRVVGGDKGDYTEVDLLSGDFRVLVDPEPPQLVSWARPALHTPTSIRSLHISSLARSQALG